MEIVGLSVLALIALLALGVPIAIAMAMVAASGIYLLAGSRFLMATLESLPYSMASQYTYVVIPMFALMGGIIARAGIMADLYSAAHKLTNGIRGGLYYATLLSSTGFATVSGSTLVSASVFTRVALPEMRRFNYNMAMAAGCIAAAGTLAALIPPSIAMVLYGILTNQSIGELLIAGVAPGLLTVMAYAIGIYIMIFFRPEWGPMDPVRYGLKEKLVSLRGVWGTVLLAVLVVGGIYTGIFAPSSAGAVGAAGALAICIIQQRYKFRILNESLEEAAIITGVIFIIIIAGLLFSRLRAVSGTIATINEFVIASGLGKYGFILAFILVAFILGMFVDGVSVMVLTMPVFFPIAMNLDINPIWFGVIVIKMIEIAAITPPIGLNLFAVLTSADKQITSGQLFRGVIPFVAMEVVVLGLIILFPAISLWLPQQMR